jgi:hypothetical protein
MMGWLPSAPTLLQRVHVLQVIATHRRCCSPQIPVSPGSPLAVPARRLRVRLRVAALVLRANSRAFKLMTPMASWSEEFEVSHIWSDLVRLHNDQENDYHIGLHDFSGCVISHQNLEEPDVLRMNLLSLWMLTHAFRAMKAGRGFQLNAVVAGKVCRKSVDLLAFSVTWIPKRNNTMWLCVIPNSTESKQSSMRNYAQQCALCPASSTAAKRIVFPAQSSRNCWPMQKCASTSTPKNSRTVSCRWRRPYATISRAGAYRGKHLGHYFKRMPQLCVEVS